MKKSVATNHEKHPRNLPADRSQAHDGNTFQSHRFAHPEAAVQLAVRGAWLENQPRLLVADVAPPATAH